MERIVTAVYPNRQQAERAKDALKSANIHPNNVRIIDADSEKRGGRYNDGRYDRLHGTSIPDDELHTYHDALDRGEALVQARVDDDEVSEAVRVLEGGVDLDEREKSYTDEHRLGTRNAYGRGKEAKSDGTVPIVEERMHIGKREVDKGTMRVRSHVVEKPIEKDVTLRDEEAQLHSKRVGRTLSPAEADELFHGKTIEVHEKGEEAVVSKDAVLKEELSVDKIATEKKKHVVDSIRETKVDVDDDTRNLGTTKKSSDERTANR